MTKKSDNRKFVHDTHVMFPARNSFKTVVIKRTSGAWTCVIMWYMVAWLLISVGTSTAMRFPPHMNTGGQEEPVEVHAKEHVVPFRPKRSVDTFPDDLDAVITSNDISASLNLHRSYDVTDDVPVAVMRSGKIVSRRVKSMQQVAYYRSHVDGAAFMVWQGFYPNGSTEYSMLGTFSVDNHEYFIQPTDTPGTGHSLSEVKLPGNGMFSDYISNPDFYMTNEDTMSLPVLDDNPTSATDSPSATPERVKRADVALEMEIFFVIDYSVFTFWYEQTTGTDSARSQTTIATIKQFYAFVINAMNVRYEGVSGIGYSLSCLYAGIYIATSADAAPFIEQNIQADEAYDRPIYDASIVLKAFRNWAETSLAQSYRYDNAMMFSNYEMGYFTDGVFSNSTIGSAYISTSCTAHRYSINEDNFDPGIVTVAAHGLGHNMGSVHDGTNNSCGYDGYIMAPSYGVTFKGDFNKRAFQFSECSEQYFLEYIEVMNTNNENCLTTRSANYDTSDLDQFSSDLAGQEYSPDQQCVYGFGDGSLLYRAAFDWDYSGICTLMYCASPNKAGSYFAAIAWEGTTCGSRKVCRAGSCVSEAEAPVVADEACIFGDMPGLVPTQNASCNEFITSSADCLLEGENCCGSCERFETDIKDCKYGDRHPHCATIDVNCYDNFTLTTCCKRCHDMKTSIPDCQYGDKVSNCVPESCHTPHSLSDCCESCYVEPNITTTTTETAAPTTTATEEAPTTTTSTEAPTTTTSADAPTTTTSPVVTTTSSRTKAPKTTHIVLTIQMTVSSAIDDTQSEQYLELKEETEQQLLLIYRKRMGDSIIRITVRHLRRGSLVVEYDVIYEDSNDAVIRMANTNIGLASGREKLTLLNDTRQASMLQVQDITVSSSNSSASACQMFTVLNVQCASGFTCALQDGEAKCVYTEDVIYKDSPGLAMMIGIIIGSVVVFIICLVTIGSALRRLRSKRRQKKTSKPDSVARNRSNDI